MTESADHAEPSADVVTGTVLHAFRGGLRVELRSGEPGWIRRNDLPPAMRAQRLDRLVGRRIKGVVTGDDAKGRGPLVSPRHLAIERFQAALGARERLRGEVVSANRGGVVVDVDGLEAFVPRQELSRRERAGHPELVGRKWRGWVTSVNAERVVLSSRSPRQRRRRRMRRGRFLLRLEVGQLRRGRIVAIRPPQGYFVRLRRSDVVALVPASEPPGDSAEAAASPRCRNGDRVRVRIAAIRPGRRFPEAEVEARLDPDE